MSPETFVAKVRNSVVEQNGLADESLFATTAVESATDPYWKRALAFQSSLAESDRRVFLR